MTQSTEDEDLVALARMPNLGAAQVAQMTLSSKGIRCVLDSPHSQFGATLDVTLLVPRGDLERAKLVIDQEPQGEYQYPADIAPDAEEERQEAIKAEAETRRKQIGRASRWVLYLAVILAVVGTVAGAAQQSLSAQAAEALARYESDAIVPFNQAAALEQEGKLVLFEEGTYTASQLRQWARAMVVLVFGYYYVLSVIYFALYFWARRSAFPALITALSVYLVLEVVKFVLDPTSFGSGILWRLFFGVALVVGIQQALVERSYREMQTEVAVAAVDD